MDKCLSLEYDVVLSFAGEDRDYVEKTANHLRKSGVKVFYDVYEDVNLWGKDLYQHLDDVYQNKAKYAVVFISEHYKKKLWTNHELKSAQARAFSEHQEYILPIRFDDSEIPGIRKTIGYVSASENSPLKLSKKILQKLGALEPVNFLPKKLTFLNKIFQTLYDVSEKDIYDHVIFLFQRLKLLNQDERKFLAHFFLHTCSGNLMDNFHEKMSLLSRVTGFDRIRILEILKGLGDVGFDYKVEKKSHGCVVDGNDVEVELVYLRFNPASRDILFENSTFMLLSMYSAPMFNRCENCLISALERLDFSDLEEKIEDSELEKILELVPNSFYEEDTEDEEDLDDMNYCQQP